MTFPPIPVFPKAIDTDHELFLVYNTTEARIITDNEPWSQEIDIVPVASTKLEIWADNGFANIEGELLYYESVDKDADGKVNIIDLALIIFNQGNSGTNFAHLDRDTNGVINMQDVNAVIGDFGRSC